jgi:hypothetical protein
MLEGEHREVGAAFEDGGRMCSNEGEEERGRAASSIEREVQWKAPTLATICRRVNERGSLIWMSLEPLRCQGVTGGCPHMQKKVQGHARYNPVLVVEELVCR